MSWDFRPGMRVVCVAKNPWIMCDKGELGGKEEPYIRHPEFGVVYTIEETNIVRGSLFIVLVEISHDDFAPSFEARFFRPLSERRLDQFRALLNNIPNDVPLQKELS